MRAFLGLVILAVLAASLALSARADETSAKRQYYEAFHAETADQNWAGAAALYRKVLADPAASAELRARARRRLAHCLDKLGRSVPEPRPGNDPEKKAAPNANAESHTAVFGEGAVACGACHVPHAKGKGPAWAAGEQRTGLFKDISSLCAGCHDGFAADPCSSAGGPGRRHHPVGVAVVAGAGDKIGKLPLFKGQVECATCHFSHKAQKGSGAPLLRIAHEGGRKKSRLCSTCHQPKKSPPLFFPRPPHPARLQHLASYVGLPSPGDRAPALEPTASDITLAMPERLSPYGLLLAGGELLLCGGGGTTGVLAFDLATGKLNGRLGGDALAGALNLARGPAGELLVLDRDRGVWALERNGPPDKPGNERPYGLAISKAELFISYPAAQRIDVHDLKSGKRLRSWKVAPKHPKSGKQARAWPSDLAIDPDQNLLLTDSVRREVRRYSPDGKLLQVFGAGHLARPRGIACDRSGRVYVVDAAYQSVCVFSPKGELLLFFGQPSGGRRGGLQQPAQVTIDYDNIGLFAGRAAPGRKIEYLVAVTSQVGARKVEVFGFLKPRPAGEAAPPQPPAHPKPGSTHPRYQAQDCTSCHAKPEKVKLLDTAARAASWTRCARCHLTAAKQRKYHLDKLDRCEPVIEAKCGSCHLPHTSANRSLLKAAAPELCQGCHKK